MEVAFTEPARKSLRLIPRKDRVRVLGKAEALAGAWQGLDIQHLGANEYRLRVGDWRVLFTREAGVVLVHKVGHRREVYR